MVIIMNNKSIWEEFNGESFEKLDKDINVDVLIIGGGITGISTLYHLKDSNLKLALVEQNKIGRSLTGKSTGKLSFLQNDLIDKIRKKYDDKVASLYLSSQIDAINKIVETVKKEKIDCDLKKVSSFLYTNKKDEISKLKNLEIFLKHNNIKINHEKNGLIKSRYEFNVIDTYIIHPVKFVYNLAKKIDMPIYENTSIKKIIKEEDYYICYVNKYKIKAKYVVLASHFPYFTIPYFFPLKCDFEKSYLSASLKKTNPISLISYSYPFVSIRTYKNKLIYLSNSDLLYKNTCDKQNFNELVKNLKKMNLKPTNLWSNTDILTNDGLPIIGVLKDNILIATGYNTWGLTNGFLSGNMIKDIILKNENKYIKLFNPHRENLNNLSNAVKNIKGYTKGLVNGTNYKCPHLGCKLIYNKVEQTFDCPCHASRFDIEGKCISAPSNKNINIKNE